MFNYSALRAKRRKKQASFPLIIIPYVIQFENNSILYGIFIKDISLLQNIRDTSLSQQLYRNFGPSNKGFYPYNFYSLIQRIDKPSPRLADSVLAPELEMEEP